MSHSFKLLVLLCVLLFGTKLQGAVITNSVTQNAFPGYTDFSIGKFDTGLGTLTNVKVIVDFSTLWGALTITNNEVASVTVDSYDSIFTFRQKNTNALGVTQYSSTLFGPITTPDWNTVIINGLASQTFDISAGQNIVTNYFQNIDSGFFSAYQSAGGAGMSYLMLRMCR